MQARDVSLLFPTFQTLPGLSQTVALAVSFQNVHPVCQSVQQGSCESLAAHNFSPVLERAS